MTHEELVVRAVWWLQRTMRCAGVLSEFHNAGQEHPDAMGWRYDATSILVECKTSLGDYYGDRSKPFRRDPRRGLGRYRYYLVPAGLVEPERLLEGWGLLWCFPSQIRKKVPAPDMGISVHRLQAELRVCYSCMARGCRQVK